MAAVYDIRNSNQVVVWRRNLDECGVEPRGNTSREQEARAPQYEVRTTLPNAAHNRYHRFGAGSA